MCIAGKNEFMSDKDVIPLAAAIAGDVLSAFSILGGNTLGLAGVKWLEKRRLAAADILIEEVSKGHHGAISFEEHDVEPLIEIIYRFTKAVADGAAMDNLRLLAQVIAGLKKNKALDPDKYRKWANVLETLTRDEIIVLGMAYRARKAIQEADPKGANDFWQRLEKSLEAGRYSKAEVQALCASLLRTGLLIALSAFGGLVYMDTPWLVELGDLANLEAVAASK
jgi:hypothetical protein